MEDKKVDVLLVDDEAIVGNRLKPALTKFGCQVEVFEDPKEALKRIDEKEFDIIVTDIMMADVNGIQLLEFAQKKSTRTKVIIITGYATEALAREAMAKGAFDMISKPFRPNDLREVIGKAAKALGFKERTVA
ncbi:MAG: response regulator [Thermodesulfobacteriota bacterium]